MLVTDIGGDTFLGGKNRRLKYGLDAVHLTRLPIIAASLYV